jgi:serine/threonine-protein kinase
MKPTDWSRLDELFQAAIGLRAADRAAYLLEACGDDDLRQEVLSLLQAHEEAETFLERPPLARAAEIAGAVGPLRIGPYQILRQLGRGGMGTVYLARNEDAPVGGELAIKVIGTDLDTELAVARFAQEKRILATLHHPNIASFFDGGTTDDGQPYLVMEYVDGEPIDRFCDRRRLSVSERIELFLSVCSAIRHAHQSLIIHRDLKPSNVLVTAEGVVKVLDFGTAKLLDPTLRLPGLASTATGLFPMTPSYACPEQVRGEPITTMSDVYALGALLYELLTGHRAHRFASAHPAEVMRVVCEVVPEPPSTVVEKTMPTSPPADSTPEESPLPTVASLRGTQLAKLQRNLAGDLDKILMKALRKEPAERYGSVESLADDLRRHLAGLPVAARSGSFHYRTRKFLQRNRTGVAAAFIAAASLVLFVASMRQEALKTERQRQGAVLEREKAETVSDFLVDLFKSDTAGGDQVRALLDRGAQELRRRPNPRPEIQASLLEASGKAYRKLGFYDLAEPLLTDALKLRRDALGEEHLDTASSLHEVALLYLEQGKVQDAEGLLRRALAIRERLAGLEAPVVADSLEGLRELGPQLSWPETEGFARRILKIRRQHLEEDHPQVGFAQFNLGLGLALGGNYQEGLSLLEPGFASLEKALAPDDPLLAEAALGLGGMLRRLGQYDRAEGLVRRARSIYEPSVGLSHPLTVACQIELGAIYFDRGEIDRAEVEFQQAHEVLKAAVGEKHPWLGSTQQYFGLICSQRGDYDCAVSRFQTVRDLYDEVLGPGSLFSSYPIHYQGALARLRGDHQPAEALLQQALEIRRRYIPETHLDIATSLGELGRLHLDRGDFAQAETLLRQTLEVQEAAFSEDNLYIATTLADLAEVQQQTNRPEEASALLERVFKIRREILGEEHELTQEVARRLKLAEAPVQAMTGSP